ncbi:MAG: YceI family protein [Candidatus Dormibacteria bacterium]
MSWNLDTVHSAVEFSVRHMMVSTVKGNFREFAVELDIDPADLTHSSAKAVIKAASVDTREPARNGHLASADFFDAEKYPEITYQSRSVKALGGDQYQIEGDLTVKDVTRPVALGVTFLGVQTSPQGVKVAGFEAATKISRKDFGLTWNMALEAGGVVIGDEIKISIDVEVNEVAAA